MIRFPVMPALRPLAWFVIGAALLVGLWLGYCALTADSRTEARLGRNQAGAAIESGRDAVDAVGRQAAAEDRIDNVTRENEHAIRNAEGADAPVAAAADAVGRASLCRRAAYRQRPECLQQPAAR